MATSSVETPATSMTSVTAMDGASRASLPISVNSLSQSSIPSLMDLDFSHIARRWSMPATDPSGMLTLLDPSLRPRLPLDDSVRATTSAPTTPRFPRINKTTYYLSFDRPADSYDSLDQLTIDSITRSVIHDESALLDLKISDRWARPTRIGLPPRTSTPVPNDVSDTTMEQLSERSNSSWRTLSPASRKPYTPHPSVFDPPTPILRRRGSLICDDDIALDVELDHTKSQNHNDEPSTAPSTTPSNDVCELQSPMDLFDQLTTTVPPLDNLPQLDQLMDLPNEIRTPLPFSSPSSSPRLPALGPDVVPLSSTPREERLNSSPINWSFEELETAFDDKSSDLEVSPAKRPNIRAASPFD